MENIPVNARFLYSAFSKFDSASAMAFFEELGAPLKTERGGRVFPVSDRANDIADSLVNCVRQNGVKVFRERALKLVTENGELTSVTTAHTIIDCSAAIICTGGVSYPLTGSTGDGYRLAESVGHTIVSPRASLVPLESKDDWCAQMQGFSLKNVVLRVYDESNRLVTTSWAKCFLPILVFPALLFYRQAPTCATMTNIVIGLKST
jgi:predicted Rossmann fold flavoprotein